MSNMTREKIQTIRDNLTEVDILMQLAEEAAELSQAASKRARILIGRNPTPKTDKENLNDLLGEFADVSLCKDVLFSNNKDGCIDRIKRQKLNRWVYRITGSSSNNEFEKNKRLKQDYNDEWYAIDIDGKRIYPGDIVQGQSDGKSWVVKKINNYKYPYCVTAECLRLDEAMHGYVTKDLKPKWLKRVHSNMDSISNVDLNSGAVIYKKDHPVPLTVKEYYRNNNDMQDEYWVVCKNGWTNDLSHINVKNVTDIPVKDSHAKIIEDMNRYADNVTGYLTDVMLMHRDKAESKTYDDKRDIMMSNLMKRLKDVK